MSLLPTFWQRRAEAPRVEHDPEALGNAVRAMVEAQMGVLHAQLKARRAFIAAQAEATDSQLAKIKLSGNLEELDNILGLTGQEG